MLKKYHDLNMLSTLKNSLHIAGSFFAIIPTITRSGFNIQPRKRQKNLRERKPGVTHSSSSSRNNHSKNASSFLCFFAIFVFY